LLAHATEKQGEVRSRVVREDLVEVLSPAFWRRKSSRYKKVRVPLTDYHKDNTPEAVRADEDGESLLQDTQVVRRLKSELEGYKQKLRIQEDAQKMSISESVEKAMFAASVEELQSQLAAKDREIEDMWEKFNAVKKEHSDRLLSLIEINSNLEESKNEAVLERNKLMKECFYSTALALKMNALLSGQACDLNVQALYEQAMEANIPSDSWSTFIGDALQA